MRYLIISIKFTVNGDFTFIEQHLLATKCKNLRFAVEYYTSHLYPYTSRIQTDKWWFDDTLVFEWVRYNEITLEQYTELDKLFNTKVNEDSSSN